MTEFPKNVTVVRNEVSWDYNLETMKKKGNNPERSAYVPSKPNDKIAERTTEKYLQHIGKEVAPLVARVHRGMSSLWHNSAMLDSTPHDKDGNFTGETDIEKFVTVFSKNAAEFSARGETLKSLREEESSLTDELLSLMDDETLTNDERKAKVKELSTRIKEVKAAIADKVESNAKDE